MGSGGPDDNDAQAGRLVVADTVRSHPRPGSNSDGSVVAFHSTGGGAKGLSPSEDVSPGVGVGRAGSVGVAHGMVVRKLMPVECERLQGLDEGWTDLGGTADTKRYSAIGDAVTVNVGEWIGGRIA